MFPDHRTVLITNTVVFKLLFQMALILKVKYGRYFLEEYLAFLAT